MTHARRALSEVLALGLANGLLLGAGLAAADRAPALFMACGAGTFITLTYLLTMRRRQSSITAFVEPQRGNTPQLL
jgi:hypothetical protein